MMPSVRSRACCTAASSRRVACASAAQSKGGARGCPRCGVAARPHPPPRQAAAPTPRARWPGAQPATPPHQAWPVIRHHTHTHYIKHQSRPTHLRDGQPHQLACEVQYAAQVCSTIAVQARPRDASGRCAHAACAAARAGGRQPPAGLNSAAAAPAPAPAAPPHHSHSHSSTSTSSISACRIRRPSSRYMRKASASAYSSTAGARRGGQGSVALGGCSVQARRRV